MQTDDSLNITPTDLSEETISASQLYAQSLMKDMLIQMSKRGKHNKARALRSKARIAKRKSKRKA